jgi:ABC-2 type transport system permease protein
VLQTAITIVLAAAFLGVPLRVAWWPLLALAMIVGTAGWFFFYAIFALQIRRNDAFNTVTSIFYFVFLFASSMFYPLDPLPDVFRRVAFANPITWQVDLLRYATVGSGDPSVLLLEALGFAAFTVAMFGGALRALYQE